LKQLFHIGNQDTNGANELLLLRLGEKHASYAFVDTNLNVASELGYYSTAEWTKDELHALAFSLDLKIRTPQKVQVGLDHSTAFIAPANISSAVMTAMHSFSSSEIILQEQAPGWQQINVFVIPQLLQHWVNEQFPDAGCVHQLTCMMKLVPSTSQQGTLIVDLREKEFQLLCGKKGQLLLSKEFPYENHEDVIYYLLQTCRQFELSQEDVELKLSGLIDKGSVLFKELYQYFIKVELRNPGWKLPDSDLPSHFFTSLNDLAACAS